MTARAPQPWIIFASLLRPKGSTGVQTHMTEFDAYLSAVGHPHAFATPFHALGTPLLLLLIGLRRVLEKICKPAAVWLYRHGHAFLLWCYLRHLMARHEECVVYAQCPMSAAMALRCVRGPRQRVVQVVHFNVSQADEWIGKGMIAPGGWMDRHIRSLEREVLTRVHGLVCVSAFMHQELLKTIPALAGMRCAVIPNFVRPLGPDERVERVQGRDLVAIGTLEARKNQRFLLEVLVLAKQRGRALTLTLVGDGPDRGMLTQFVAEHGIAEQVHFEGFAPGARAFIPGHRLFVHAALMESQGIVLLEALSTAVPVLAPAVGGVVEVFEDGVQGRFWPLDDPKRACDILLSTLDDEPGLASMRSAALTRFQTHFEAAAVGQNLLSFLKG